VCGVQKLVCTTIQPTELPFGELYDWHGAADFVADYLNFIPLQPPHELVSSLSASGPCTVLRAIIFLDSSTYFSAAWLLAVNTQHSNVIFHTS